MSPAIPNQLQCQAHRDDPTCALAWADEAAWAKAEGHGSAAATEAIRRKDAEAWIPGLPARRTVMSMGWVIFFAVVAGGALSWAPDYAVVDWIAAALKIVAALAVVAAAWSILSEMRGWEGSDASGWLLKRRTKRFRKPSRHAEARSATLLSRSVSRPSPSTASGRVRSSPRHTPGRMSRRLPSSRPVATCRCG